MKKTAVSIMTLFLLTLAVGAFAAEAVSEVAAEPTPIENDSPATPEDAFASAAPGEALPPAPADEPAPAPVDAEAQVVENLEFISGEVTAADEPNKAVTVKLYGETETAGDEKVLTVKVNESTDITDGEKDRDLKSLTAGTEVDVEYDPANNLATYIFVY